MDASLPGLEGKYQILAKLREGGMGAIYKVRHRLLDEVRVVKVMKPQLAGDASFAERFLREARAAAKLRHPNIAQVYDFAVGEDGAAYIVMEYIDGVDLRELLQRDTLPPVRTVIEVGVQALDALDFLHRHRFVHRDISPDNLMIRDRPRGGTEVKLIDLGIAKHLGQDGAMTRAGEFLGKFHYASPEHFGGHTGEGEVEPRSDLYSLGLVLYELLTGERAYPGKDFSALTAAHLLKPPRDFAETDPGGRVPAGLREVVLRSLAKDPDERFADAAAMRDALETVRDEPTEEPGEWTVARTLALDRSAQEAEGETVVPGSTQDRLDREFPRELPSAAPGPGSREALTAPTVPARASARRSPLPWIAVAVVGLAAMAGLVFGLGWYRGVPEKPVVPPPEPTSDSRILEPTSWEIEGEDDSPDPSPPPGTVERPPPVDRTARLEAMADAREEIQAAERSDRGPGEKAEAWRRFLEIYAADVPGTAEDEEIRAHARRRLGYWEGQSAAQAEHQRLAAVRREAVSEEPVVEPAPLPDLEPARQADPRAEALRVQTPEEARRFLAERDVPVSEASLRQAVARDDPEAVKILLLAGPGMRPRALRTVFEESLEHGKFQIAQAFVDAGVRPPDDLLEDAAAEGRLDLVRFLVENGVGDREDALEEALDEEEWRVARYLVEEGGVPLASFMDEAEDLLIEAAERGDGEVVAWLLGAGVDPRGGAGEDALEEAESNGHRDVARMIRRARGQGR